jgi:hypothetical protein
MVSRKHVPLTFLLIAALASFGCWEEIRYKPSPAANGADENPPASKPVDASTAAPDQPPAADTSGALVDAQPPSADLPSAGFPSEASSSLEPAQTATPRQQLLVWRTASKWSLAVAAYAKGLEASRYEPLRREAAEAAAELDLDLPELPTAGDDSPLEAAVIDSLRTGSGAGLADVATERFGRKAGAAARLAVGSHLLLLAYSPQDPAAAAEAMALREAAETAELPAELWRPLTELLEKQAEFLDVRGAVFEMHRQVEEHLGRL